MEVSLPKKFGWGLLYGAAGGLAGVLVNGMPQIHINNPVLQSILSIGVVAATSGLAKLLKALAGKTA